MKIFITGNMGYVGSTLVRHLRRRFPDVFLHGYDDAFFAHCLTNCGSAPESVLDRQTFGDVREFADVSLKGYDAVVHLAAVSNDPMGSCFADVTAAINRDASISVARAAQAAGVRNFVFASSCSVYGVASGGARREDDALNPMTAYAASKIDTEKALAALEGDMTITCLRFATACGMSERLRLDLVLSDFVACALTSGMITVLSDGTPWRPLIDTADMARAIEWAILRPPEQGGRYLTVNTGSNECNYQIRTLAEAVSREVAGTTVDINLAAPVDSRSYQVDFSLYADLAPDHQPQVTLTQSIRETVEGLKGFGFADADFRNSSLIRLRTLQEHIRHGRLSDSLKWTCKDAKAGLENDEDRVVGRRARHAA